MLWKPFFAGLGEMSLLLRIASVVFGILVSCLPVFFLLAHWSMWQNVRKRFGESIMATPETLTFSSKAQRIEARWDEVVDYRVLFFWRRLTTCNPTLG